MEPSWVRENGRPQSVPAKILSTSEFAEFASVGMVVEHTGLESRSFVRSVPGWWNAPRKKTAMGPAALRCFQALQPMNLLACFILVFRDISTAGLFRRHLDGPTRFMWRCGRCHRVLSANVVFLSTRAPFGKTFTDLLNEGRHPNRWPNALVNAWLTSSLQ